MRNYISLSGDLQIIKKTMTPTEFKGFLKGRLLELRLACAEPDIVVSDLQKMIAVYSEELNSMNDKKQSTEDISTSNHSNTSEDLSEKEAESF